MARRMTDQHRLRTGPLGLLDEFLQRGLLLRNVNDQYVEARFAGVLEKGRPVAALGCIHQNADREGLH
jgi:hypothetical protein